jgi:hypothetical protein
VAYKEWPAFQFFLMGGQGPSKPREGKTDRDKGQGGTREGAEQLCVFNSMETKSTVEQKREAIHPLLLGKGEGQAEDWGKRVSRLNT